MGMGMEWMTVQEAGKEWGVTTRRVQYLCAAGKVKGAQKRGHIWAIPQETKKPADGRTKSARLEKGKKAAPAHDSTAV